MKYLKIKKKKIFSFIKKFMYFGEIILIDDSAPMTGVEKTLAVREIQ